MTPERFRLWITTWFAQHPLRRPPENASVSYVREVLARVRAPSPEPVMVLWAHPRVRLAMAFGAACAGILIGLFVTQHTNERVAQRIMRDGMTLASMDELDDALPVASDEELAEIDEMIILAESTSPASDEALFDEMTFLEDLDEGHDASDTTDATEDDVWQDLQWLDDAQVSTAS